MKLTMESPCNRESHPIMDRKPLVKQEGERIIRSCWSGASGYKKYLFQ